MLRILALALQAAVLLSLVNVPVAKSTIVARMPRMMMTIRSSMSVKPLSFSARARSLEIIAFGSLRGGSVALSLVSCHQLPATGGIGGTRQTSERIGVLTRL